MYFKLLFFLAALFLVDCTFAQKRNYPTIRLNKIGSFDNKTIKITQKIVFKVKSDSAIYTLKIKPYKYEFPYLYYKNENDSTFIDVRKIESLDLNTNSSKFIILTTSVISGLSGITLLVLSKPDPYPPIVAMGIGLCLISGKIGYSAFKSYNTKTEWSFY
ncbi:MAG: hypothetical protein ACOYMA_08110 [Bacteroidia bacterium]